ncbi:MULTISPECIES: SDR family oxidoreductase [unclassified Caballeronia]|uniref:SDR family NAD(P)-dependent oxidoreductase n=1 Tax=unclassified Caballeronia TaxID=2646786 RepID=UPI002860D968|nr:MULTISPECIES: SDR family oxidoreductase [unclassified Caballeronia]MDR5777316.1 SDR family NAD(P)-dependent oxidoreductase [Caballeronia sp. LZ002]MDR5852752.1 SDR family NAD(P)-dependent oxidoreductase [Caballeronia sp. LZ003]
MSLVTGAAGNLGQALAQLLHARGDHVVLIDRDGDRLRSVFEENTTRLLLSPDLTNADAVQQAVQTVLGHWGRIDTLCNVAGGFRMGQAVHETDDATWEFLFGLNARSVIHMARAVAPVMLAQRSGSIVNVAAVTGERAAARMGAYAASKAAVMRLTEAMAAELRPSGIRVNCVLPTIIDTPENRAAMPDADTAQWVSTDAAARVIAFLASGDAAAISGAAVPLSSSA